MGCPHDPYDKYLFRFREKKDEKVSDKVEKKPSAAARVARGLGLKRHDKDPAAKVQNGGTEKSVPASPTSVAPPVPMPVTLNNQLSNNLRQHAGNPAPLVINKTSLIGPQPPIALPGTPQQQQPSTPTLSNILQVQNSTSSAVPPIHQAYRLDRYLLLMYLVKNMSWRKNYVLLSLNAYMHF